MQAYLLALVPLTYNKRLINKRIFAAVVKLVYTLASGVSENNLVEVRYAGGMPQGNLSDCKLCLQYESFGVAERDQVLYNQLRSSFCGRGGIGRRASFRS